MKSAQFKLSSAIFSAESNHTSTMYETSEVPEQSKVHFFVASLHGSIAQMMSFLWQCYRCDSMSLGSFCSLTTPLLYWAAVQLLSGNLHLKIGVSSNI